MAYLHALDLFGGNVPFVTEADAPGAFLPKQTNKQDLFNYIESELKAIDADLAAPTLPTMAGPTKQPPGPY